MMKCGVYEAMQIRARFWWIKKTRASLFLVPAICLICAQAMAACDAQQPPKGAIDLNYNKLAFDLCPKVSDISMSGRGSLTALYNGVWWRQNQPASTLYGDNPDGSLRIGYTGVVATVPINMVPGKLPLLQGSRGFFVEFEVSLSSDDPDHWPAVWLMPIEHNGRLEDNYPPDNKGFERWLEIDVDEGGFSPGAMGTAISWVGKWPDYKMTRSNPDLKNAKIDRRERHRFGAGFDPKTLSITFWHNGKIQYVASGPSVPEIAKRQNFYVIMNAQSRKTKLDYQMNIYRVRAFLPD